ncbi:MAG: thermonuclease family protein [Thermoanaerobaculales bacterium]|jgi:micrococcal nuclease|nr:thermonuclease family protein [Thermoanaerobaculales bacterium]
MKPKTILSVTLVVVGIVAVGATAGPTSIAGTCIKVIDGDTLVVDCDHARRTVEIAGIDAPEIEQPWGKEVRSFVRSMVDGERVEIEVVEAGDDVVRARVSINGVDLSELLVGRGLAWVVDGSGDGELAELGERARALPCGLWTDPEPQAPWSFRESRS